MSDFNAQSSHTARQTFGRASAPAPALSPEDFAALLPPNPLHFYQPVTRARLHDNDGAEAQIEVFADPGTGLYKGSVTARIGESTLTSRLYAHQNTGTGLYRIDSLVIDNQAIDLGDRDAVRTALDTFIAYKNAGLPAEGNSPRALFPRPVAAEAAPEASAPKPGLK